MKILLFVIFSFFLPSFLHAASPVRIRIVYVPGQYALTTSEVAVFNKDLTRYLRTNISRNIRITYLTKSAPAPTSFEDDGDLFNTLARLNTRRFALTHYVYPPTIENGQLWIFGWAFTCAPYPYNNSYSTAVIGLYYPSLTAAAHEIAHQLGAKHRSGLMDTNALAFSKDAIPLPRASTLKDIYKCGRNITKPEPLRCGP